MKVLDLHCSLGHSFEGWLASEEDYQGQLARGLVSCPLCGDKAVTKKLSAPRLNLRASSAKDDAAQAAPASEYADHRSAAWLALARKVIAQTEDVGAEFVDESRRMHRGDIPERAIRGQATMAQAVQLLEEGIPVLPLPMDDALKNPVQ